MKLILLHYSQSLKAVSETALMCYGVVFQEYHILRKMMSSGAKIRALSTLWVTLATFLAMAYSGNLKASLVRRDYGRRTATLDEMVDRDAEVHLSGALLKYLRHSGGPRSLNARLACQVEKRGTAVELW